MRALALDVGSKTIGLARSDADGLIATSWDVVTRRGHAEDAREILARVLQIDASVVVVGLPLELDGREGRRAKAVRRFVQVLEPALSANAKPVRVVMWDERFSTVAAERTLLEADVSRAGRKRKIDALAAQFILQGWLDAQRRSEESA